MAIFSSFIFELPFQINFQHTWNDLNYYQQQLEAVTTLKYRV